MVWSVCQWLGVAIETASIDLSSSSFRRSVYAAGRFLPAASIVFTPLSRPTRRRRKRGDLDVGHLQIRLMCALPRPLNPTTATLTVLFGL